MFSKILWKMALFSLGMFMLLLTMGYGHGHGTDAAPKMWETFSGQAKIAQPGARVAGFRKVAPEAAPEEKTIWDTIRDTTSLWMGGQNMMGGNRDAGKSELQKLNNRTKRRDGMATMLSL